MNKKHLNKVLGLLVVLGVSQADAALLLNSSGTGYNVIDFCFGCAGNTSLDVNIQANNTPVVLNFDPLGSYSETFDLVFRNQTGVEWTSFSIEYVVSDPIVPVYLGLQILDAGTSVPVISTVLRNPVTDMVSGMEVSFTPPEASYIYIVGDGSREPYTGYLEYSLVITTSTVPVPAAVWLFGSGLLGLVGFARRKQG